MKDSIVAYVFLLLFAVIIIAPVAIMILDDDADVSCFYSISEEEENNGNEKNKALDLLIFKPILGPFSNFDVERPLTMAYATRKYSKPQLNIVSPPPKFIS
ncbi:hypothetical protein [Sediminibacter sp. Hel_I_10]|uniref:hypothetical protein n=1 Tax=Sediminibacter sp. Hel_I_10 TaxID=1392490 RepID=UPI00047C5225|nr:hypothetical protein [Sediminibacter sp. Hel_I_10]